MASLYQNAGPPGTYRQNQGPPPPPPPSQYPTSNAYNYANTQPPSYGANMGPHSQMAYNPSYGYGGSNASYGPPGVASQNQYPPLPPYSIPSQPPPPPPPPLSAAPPPPPPPPLPPMSSVQPPPPPPLQPTSHHGVAYVPPNTNSTSQGYQEGIHSAYYPSAHSTQLPPPPPPPSSYVSSSQAPSSLHSGTGLSMQTGSAPAASSRQNTIQASASTWLSSGEASKTTLKPTSALKPGAANALDKVPGASRVSSASKPPPTKADNRIESDRELRERKRREYERRKLEEKKEVKMHTQAMQKFPPAGTPLVKHNSGINLRDGRTDRKDKVDNRLKRPSTFVCKIKFRNELPDPVSQPKLLQVNSDRDRYSKYSITSLEKTQKHRLLVDSDLGVPLDLLDISIYNAPKVRPPMDPEDEELLRDDEKLPSAKTVNIRKKDRPTDKGVAWLVKTQYISSINLDPAKQALTEKQAKEQKEIREGKRDFLESLNDREHQIRSIQESFRVAQQVPVHQTKPHLQPVEVFPLLPDFNRQSSRLTHVTFDGEPTADSELHNKLEQAVRDELEALAILKTYNLSDAETGRQERFLAYMVPKVEELNSDYMNEMSYTWMREYHMEARPEETQNLSSYVFSFGEDSVQYLPLQQKISLRKKKAKERFTEDFESTFAVPSSVTVQRGEEEDQAGDDEDGSGRSAHRQSRAEGISHGESRNSHGLKRRQSSDDGEFTRMPKRKEVNRNMSDDDEDAYM